MTTLTEPQLSHITTLLKQKFISPYKIIYMIDQKQADYFKARNESTGCCTATQITIPVSQRSKIERYLAQLITSTSIRGCLDQLLGYCQDRYKNIVQKGKQDNLKITPEVQKYLIDNILSEAVNNHIHKKLLQKLSTQTKNITTEIGLWATPATWYARYPHVPLQLFSSVAVGELFRNGYTVLSGVFEPYIGGLYAELVLLERDGRFQEILWKNKQQYSNQQKILRNPQTYINKTSQQPQRLKNLDTVCILLQSIPFELNKNCNSYLTISDTIQAYYYKNNAYNRGKKLTNCKYQTLLSTSNMKIVIKDKQVIELRPGSLFVVSDGCCQFQFCSQDDGNGHSVFVLTTVVNQARRKQ